MDGGAACGVVGQLETALRGGTVPHSGQQSGEAAEIVAALDASVAGSTSAGAPVADRPEERHLRGYRNDEQEKPVGGFKRPPMPGRPPYLGGSPIDIDSANS